MKPVWMLLLLLPATVAAQTVYRCGHTYQDVPCAASQPGRALDVADARSPAEVKAAQASARAEARRTEALTAERHTRERAAARAASARRQAAKAEPPKPAASKPAPADKPLLYRAVK